MYKKIGILFFFLFSIHNAYSTIHYPFISKNKRTEALFDKGMLNFYGYLYSQAEDDFRSALKQDPNCGLCYFGLAIAKRQQALELGMPITGFKEITKAKELIQAKHNHLSETNIKQELHSLYPSSTLQAPSPHAWGEGNKEKALGAHAFYKDLIEAAGQAFSEDASVPTHELQANYIKALEDLYDKYKKDDVFKEESLALYVDAIAYFSAAGDESKNHCSRLVNEELKEKALALLRPVLKDHSYPDHPGLMHTYIHLAERDIKDPLGKTVASKLPLFSGGLIAHYAHMPNHIYWRRGLYDKAIEANWNAIKIDKNYFKHRGVGFNTYYYEYHYLHSYHFLSILGVLTNNYPLALHQAKALKKLMNAKRIEHLKDYRDVFFTLEHLVNLRFNKWQEVLDLKTPAQTQELGQLLIRYSKALAYLHLKQNKAFETLFSEIKNEHYQRDQMKQMQTLVVTYLKASQMAILKKPLDELEHLFLENKVNDIEKALYVMNPPLWFFPYQLFLSDEAFLRSDFKSALWHHHLYEKMYPHSCLGKIMKRWGHENK